MYKLSMKDLKKRHLKVCYYLLEHNFPVSLSKISKELGYSVNTLKKDLPLIESLLQEKNIKLIKKPRVGIIVKADLKDIECFKKELKEKIGIIHDKNERFVKTALIFLFSNEPPTIEKLSEMLEVSSVSAYNYVKKVKEYLQKFGIILRGYSRRGYYLLGEEEKIREIAIDLILSYYYNDWLKLWEEILGNNINILRDLLIDLDIKKLISILERVEEIYKFKLDDMYFVKLLLRFVVALQRIRMGKIIKEKVKLSLNREFKEEVKKIVLEIKKELGIDIPESEYSYLFYSISMFIRYGNYDVDFNNIMNILLNSLDRHLLDNLYENYHLLETLAYHLLRSIQKVRSGAKIENPLLELIKETYADEFNVGRYIIGQVNKKFSIELDENEVGYVTLYINILKENAKRKKIAIVCPMGIATSNMLYWKLKQEFPNLEIVDVLSYKDFIKKYTLLNVDLIVSTAPLPVNVIPYVIVSPLLTKNEVEVLRKILLS